MEKTVVWYALTNGGDGSAWLLWFPSEYHAQKHQETEDEGPQFEIGNVETFIGSEVHKRSLQDPLGPEQL